VLPGEAVILNAASMPRTGTKLAASLAPSQRRVDRAMNWQFIQSNWKNLQERLNERWLDLNEGDIERADASRDELVTPLQDRYGAGRDEAEPAREFVQPRQMEEAAQDAAPQRADADQDVKRGASRPRCGEAAVRLAANLPTMDTDKIQDPEQPREEPPPDPNVDPLDPQQAPVPQREPPNDGQKPPTRLAPDSDLSIRPIFSDATDDRVPEPDVVPPPRATVDPLLGPAVIPPNGPKVDPPSGPSDVERPSRGPKQ
jgi:hypothetical protein